jgi:hypothetical protein
MHDKFHISLLEPYKPVGQAAPLPPPPVELEDEDKYEAEAILDSKCEGGIMSYYVKWVGYSEDECSWEPVEHMTNAADLIKEYHADYLDALWAPRDQTDHEVRSIQNPSPNREGDTTSCRIPHT